LVFLGLFIVMVAILFGGEFIRENSGSAKVTLLDDTVPWLNTDAKVFAAGAVASALILIGLMIAYRGARRAIRGGRELDDLRDDHTESVTMLLRENAGMRRELQRYRDEGVLDTRVAGQPIS
jgi:hypothetical protein